MGFIKNILGKKDEPMKSYQDFWKWFQKNEKTFFKAVKEGNNIEKAFFNKLSPKLDKMKEGFYYLTGMFNSDTAELIFTAEGSLKNIVFVEELVAAAPAIEGWLFSALKAPSSSEVSIEMDGYTFDNKNIHFYSNDNAYFPDEINISIVHDALTTKNKNVIGNGVFIFLDNFLGELNFVESIDSLSLVAKKDAEQPLVPIEKLKAFLNWRQKEFVEKYDGVRHDSSNDNYSLFKAELDNGNALIATINMDLLEWDSKASHPWILNIDLKYDGEDNRGMPTKDQTDLLEEIEENILSELKSSDGFLNIGRQTADSIREIYFACNDFRKPSKVLHQIALKYAPQLEINYDIYKDKYWESFGRFTK